MSMVFRQNSNDPELATFSTESAMSGHPPASRQMSPTKLSDSVRSQCLFTTLTRAPAHFPEFNFEPRGFLEDRDQLGDRPQPAQSFTCRFISTSRMAERPVAASRMSASFGAL